MTINTQLAGKSQEELIAIIAQMQVASQRKLTLKVSEKGAVSLYGLGRFPVTLYASQWERLIAFIPEVKAFIDANRGQMAVRT